MFIPGRRGGNGEEKIPGTTQMTIFIALTMAVWALTAIVAFVRKDK